ncbi:hypothetical protein HFP89_15115 [Wenzhouxiangella sp. XN79A]|uniref:DUF6116 family protein n=1 Tax=Wenzhouxiangella sp. XN79A TaxID=2724193 RepID=UPI00144A51B6|nr:DUF6116 family protein [Wenzhouxiangella sp. XN79A]NKI36499.1 hypothetical protein [Wenzhouxiangella sp. XN79A]
MLLPAIRRFLRRRRFPTLMLIGAVLFLINLAVPDPLPFIDEILLLIGTLIVGSFRDRGRKDGSAERGTDEAADRD